MKRKREHKKIKEVKTPPNQELRVSLGLTQKQMAHLMGLERASISMYESGLRHLPTAVSRRFHDIYQFLEALSEIPMPQPPESDLNIALQILDDLLSKHGDMRIILNRKKKEADLAFEKSKRLWLVLENWETIQHSELPIEYDQENFDALVSLSGPRNFLMIWNTILKINLAIARNESTITTLEEEKLKLIKLNPPPANS
ncbi:MAG TPA: helix-turn-helix transcriptional regulator [Catalimonadaceae bacterium]|nr:helix-turn-helix transcriptional regulator [Catalimonadaceae bacterium]